MKAEVVIIGAGTAGAAAAGACARAGFDVLCVDAGPLDRAGARWVNGVAAWCFDEAGVALPTGPELRSTEGDYHIVCGWGPERVTVRGHSVLDVDMRLLVERLQANALEAGARFADNVRVRGPGADGLVTDRGPIRGEYYIDASGLGGIGLLPNAHPGRRNLCAAAQEVRQLRDRAAAERFFEANAASPHDTLVFTGVAGGYSIVNVRLEGDEVALLTGSIPADGHPSGARLLAEFVERHSWIGERVFGGARAIPLGRGCDLLATERCARIGDAALQVFAGHGSGIGAGLVAARMVADALRGSGDLRDYERRWHRELGVLFAASDAFRRFSRELAPGEMLQLVRAGVIDETSARAALEMRLPRLDPRMLGRMVALAPRAARLTARLVSVAGRSGAAVALLARRPHEPHALRRWSARMDALLGPARVDVDSASPDN